MAAKIDEAPMTTSPSRKSGCETVEAKNPARYGSHAAGWLSGQSEMSDRIRSFEWSRTPLGGREDWPQSLITTITLMLNSRYPMFLAWGPERTFVYNDAYRPILGKRHPDALGRPVDEIWKEIWDVLGPQMDMVLKEQRATWNEDLLLVMERNGYAEETYFTFSYSPAMEDSGRVAGVFCACNETTGRVLSERRLSILRGLAIHATEATTVETACRTALTTLSHHEIDVPFALLFLFSTDRSKLRLAGTLPAEVSLPHAKTFDDVTTIGADDPWRVMEVANTGQQVSLTDLRRTVGCLPTGPWTVEPNEAVVLPLTTVGQERCAGVLIVGINPRRPRDHEYDGFLHLLGGQIATAISNARSYEEERQRAEALAELDRAKTAFFSNVSHEFRTPLTLMLSPVEELLARHQADLSPAATEQLQIVNRNGLRLLRLVNSLLDFSRIEAGRVQARYEPTDLAAFTADVASCFRAATERAGLRLIVDCPSLSEPVYVDRDMWEKIVSNLLSNAFKFTFEGGIEVSLRTEDSGLRTESSKSDNSALSPQHSALTRSVTLRVTDTGVGIPAQEMPRLFERFHRVQNMRSRTHEGSGIGLALIQEMAKLHGGFVRAESRLDEGSTFLVSIPLGHAHLPAKQIGPARRSASTAIGAEPFVEEALRWLPEDVSGEASGVRSGIRQDAPSAQVALRLTPGTSQELRPRILVADDNADMRQYLTRLLAERFTVDAVADGEAALASARTHPPDLILSDVMMPRLDGFGLLQAVRSDSTLNTIPLMLLSARAGEESRVEGLEYGADDYLIKPFSARELLARVTARVEIARIRKEADHALRESEARSRALINGVHDYALFMLDADGRVNSWYEGAERMIGYPAEEIVGRHYSILFTAEAIAQGQPTSNLQAAENGPSHEQNEWRVRKDGSRFLANTIITALRHVDHTQQGFAVILRDVTERKRAEDALRESEERYRMTFAGAAVGIAHVGLDGRWLRFNDAVCSITGYTRDELQTMTFMDITHPDDVESDWAEARRLLAGEIDTYSMNKRYVRKDGSPTWANLTVSLLRDAEQRPLHFISVIESIAERKRAEEVIQHRTRQLDLLARTSQRLILSDKPDTELLEHMFTEIGRMIDMEGFYHYRLMDESSRLQLQSSRDIIEHERFDVMRFGEFLRGRLAEPPQAILVEDLQRSDHADSAALRAAGVTSYTGFPLSVRGELLGIVVFVSRRRTHVREGDMQMVQTLCEQTAVRIDRAKLLQELQVNELRLARQEEALELAIGGAGFQEIARFIARAAQEQAGDGARTGLCLVDGEEKRLRFVASAGLPDTFVNAVDGFDMTADNPFSCPVFSADEHVMVYDIEEDSLWAPYLNLARTHQVRAYFAFPIRSSEGSVLGILPVYYRTPHEPTPELVDTMEALTHTAAVIIEWHRASEERARTQQALLESEERFRTLADHMSQFAWMADADGRMFWYNQRWLDYTGTTLEDMQGWGWTTVQHPDHVDRVIARIQQSWDTGETWEDTFPMRGKDGQYRWFLSRAVPIRDADGRIIRWFGTNTDITDLREAEQAQAHLAAIVASSDDAIISKDLNGIILSWNRGAQGIFGYTEQEAVGRSVTMLMPPDRVDEEPTILARIKKGETVAHYETVRRRKDGSLFDISLTVSPLRDDQGRIIGASKVARDITQRKRHEEELRRWKDELEVRVRERTQELLATQERLMTVTSQLSLTEQQERRKLARDLHDYLAQMLVVGQMKTRMMRKQMPSGLSDNRMVQDVDQIFQDALAYTRTLIAELSPPSLHDSGLPSALKWLGERFEKDGLQVEVRAECASVPMQEEQSVVVFQAVRELLFNVMKHAGVDRAIVTVKLDEHDILRVAVSDQGKGLGGDAQQRSSKPGHLGLASVRERFKAMGGRVEVESALRQGTTVTLVLPMGEVKGERLEMKGKKSDAIASCRTPHTSPTIRVLLVDDHKLVRQGLRDLLASEDRIRVVGEADSCEEALMLAANLDPDVVVTDINMPTMDGIEATKRFKKLHPQIVVIGLSFHTEEQMKRDMISAGAVTLLAKDSAALELAVAIIRSYDERIPIS